MSDNPLEPDPAREEKIRQRAYHLWDADGRPHGRDAEYWERASELVGMEGSAGSGQLPNPATLPGADPYRVEPIEEAFIQENLGEFPDRRTDQGEVLQTPRAHTDATQAAATQADDSPSPGAAGEAADRTEAKPAGKAASAGDAQPKPKRAAKNKS